MNQPAKGKDDDEKSVLIDTWWNVNLDVCPFCEAGLKF